MDRWYAERGGPLGRHSAGYWLRVSLGEVPAGGVSAATAWSRATDGAWLERSRRPPHRRGLVVRLNGQSPDV